MAAPEQPVDRLLVAVFKDTAFISVRGRGSFKVSAAMKEFVNAEIAQGCRRLVLDMADCVGMDSTFMGVLAGLAARLKGQGAGKIVMVNLSLRTRGLLTTLGLDQVIEPHMAGDTPSDIQPCVASQGDQAPLDTREKSPQATAETVVEAHEALVRLSPENLPRFKDVLNFLREDLKKADSSRPGNA
jgi:anti-sigma B factor antagonist